MKPWEESEESLQWFRAAAAEVMRQARENPDFPILVDPDVAEFMGVFDESDEMESQDSFCFDEEIEVKIKDKHRRDLLKKIQKK